MIKHHCQTCDIYFSTKYTLEAHYDTVKHKKILENPSVKANCKSCTICGITFKSRSELITHLDSKNHKKTIERITILNNTINDICTIPIRNKKGDVIGNTMIDKEIYPLIMDNAININPHGYATIYVNGSSHFLHRYVYYDLFGKIPLDDTNIDHKDRNKLNNILTNLREVTFENNARNREKREDCTSKYYGVSKNGTNWRCSLKHNNIEHAYLYNNELHAAYHRDLLVKEFKLEDYSTLNNVECPEDFIIKTKYVKKSGLPKHISTQKNKYRCTFRGELRDKTKAGFITVEEAVLYRDQIIQTNEKQKLEDLKKDYNGPILRNSENIALFNITNINKEIVGQTLVDDDIYCYLMKYSRTLSLNKKKYVMLFINGKQERFHRWVINYFGRFKIDHIDRNPLNNQKSNLRISTDLQNAQNKSSSKNSTSKYVGIGFNKKNEKWKVQIQGEQLGNFDMEEEAVIVRNKRAQELNDEGARYPIQIYDGPTNKNQQTQINIETNEFDKQLETNSETTQSHEIHNTEKEYIMSIKKVTVLINLVKDKKLNVRNGGPITIDKIRLNNLEEHKNIIINILYPSQ